MENIELSGVAGDKSGVLLDSLTDALIYLAAHHGRAISREALLAGLPISDNRLSPGLFARAASHAGLEAEAQRRRLSDIPAIVLPAVLTLRDGSTRILLSIDHKRKTAKIIDPSAPELEEVRKLRELKREYLGYAFLVRPQMATDPRAVAAGGLPRRHWFWSVVRRFWVNYSHVALAALVINLLALASPLFVMNVYDRVLPNGAIPSLVALGIGMGIAIIFDLIIRTVRSRIIDTTGKKVDVVLASDIFEHVISLKMSQRPG